MRKLVIVLMILSLSLTFLVFSIEQSAYNKDYYLKKYKENDIEKVTGRNMQELEYITDDLILYLKGGHNKLLRPQFNEREILHMEDVRELFNLARTIKYIGIALTIFSFVYFITKKQLKLLAKALLYGLFLNHILFFIIGLLAYIDFNKYFTYFHLIFFTNDLWILNPKTDLMIQMLPENFFFGMAKNIMISFLIYLAILQVVSYLYLRKDMVKYEKVGRET